MPEAQIVLLILAVICFAVNAFKAPLGLTVRVDLFSLGWAFAVGSALAGAL